MGHGVRGLSSQAARVRLLHAGGVLVYSEFAGCASSFSRRCVDREPVRRRFGRGNRGRPTKSTLSSASALRLRRVGSMAWSAHGRCPHRRRRRVTQRLSDEGDGATTATSCPREIREHVYRLVVGASISEGTAVSSRAHRGARDFVASRRGSITVLLRTVSTTITSVGVRWRPGASCFTTKTGAAVADISLSSAA